MEIHNFEDNEDGSATITLDLTAEEVIAFAKIGLLDTLRESAEKITATEQEWEPENVEHYMYSDTISDRDEIECRSKNPAKICEGCTCWKNQNE